MTVDVSKRDHSASLVRAICHVYRASHSVPERYYSPIAAVIEQMVWDLADMVNHTDVTGQSITYRAGNVGVVVRVDQFVRSLRYVERKVSWATKTYGD